MNLPRIHPGVLDGTMQARNEGPTLFLSAASFSLNF